MSTKWILGMEGGTAGPFYSIVSQSGEVIAMQVPSRSRADEIIYAHNNEDALAARLQETEAELAALRGAQEWISVNQPPAESGLYDVWRPGFYVPVRSNFLFMKWDIPDITHWRHLPQPPQEQEEVKDV
jgi:hypothetical protein